VQSLIGLLSTALMTGLMFAKFSRPTSRIVFSRVACISLRDGVPSLIFRVTNERGNQVAEAQLNVVIFRSETTSEGEPVRRFYDLPLWRQRSPIFALTWTAVHQILPGSELHGQTQASLQAVDAEVLVTFTGTDSTLAQPVHARHAYRVGDLRWNERFVDLFGIDEQGRRYVDYHQFHNTVPMADAAQVGQPSDPPATGT
jgi:inward rectifier potassium channel